jgi:hypothetical protein
VLELLVWAQPGLLGQVLE